MSDFIPTGLGWCQDNPDFRDYVPTSPTVTQMMLALEAGPSPLPESTDLREYFSTVCDQQSLKASAAFACVSLVEYFHRRAFGKSLEPSALFLHRSAAEIGGTVGSPGLDLRSHLHAMVTFGIPPAHQWPYDPVKAQQEPGPSLYSYSEQYRSIQYVRLDARNGTGEDTLGVVKAFLAAGFPCAFGFSVPSSMSADGEIPYRPTFDFVRGGFAVVAVGYDNRHLHETRGALLVRSSWATSWGDEGYGWLPYAYVEQQLATSFWTLLKEDWLQSREFSRPSVLE